MKNISVAEQYLNRSEETLSEQGVSQRTICNDLYHDAAELMHAGNLCDRTKRTIFYKDANADDRFTEQSNRITEIINKIPGGSINPRELSQFETDLFHAALGVGSESGEVMEAVISGIFGGELDFINMKEEVGDILWYLAIICRRLGFTFEEAMNSNIDKLNYKRFKNGFNTQDAVNRDVVGERKVLEGK